MCYTNMLVIWCKSAIKILFGNGWLFGVNNQPIYAYCVCGSSTCLMKSIYSSFVIGWDLYLTRRRDDEAVEKKKSINKIVRKTIHGVADSCNAVGLSQTYTTRQILVCGWCEITYEQDVDTLNEIVTRCHIKDYDLQKVKLHLSERAQGTVE